MPLDTVISKTAAVFNKSSGQIAQFGLNKVLQNQLVATQLLGKYLNQGSASDPTVLSNISHHLATIARNPAFSNIDLQALGKLELKDSVSFQLGAVTVPVTASGNSTQASSTPGSTSSVLVTVVESSGPVSNPANHNPVVNPGDQPWQLVTSQRNVTTLPAFSLKTATPANLHQLHVVDPDLTQTAYVLADEVDFSDNTIAVLNGQSRVVIICRTLKFGQNVQFAGELLSPPAAPNPRKQPTPANPFNGAASKMTFIGQPGQMPTGLPGTNGPAGNPGNQGIDAPKLEIYALNISGFPSVCHLQGYAGQQGQDGGDGNPGQDGGAGTDAKYDFVGFRTAGRGNGGNGGNGGLAGAGGAGGPGGGGGDFLIAAPSATLQTLTNQATVFSCASGNGGNGGIGGRGGLGGRAGAVGNDAHGADSHDGRTAGNAGANQPSAANGANGAMGSAGSFSARNLSLQDFDKAFEAPGIATVVINGVTENPGKIFTKAGDTVQLTGFNFATVVAPHAALLVTIFNSSGSKALVNATVIDANHASFVFPKDACGGPQALQVTRVDGSVSNLISIEVVPTVATPSAPLVPGRSFTLSGSGFAPSMNITLGGVPQENIQFISATQAQFTVVRPDGLTLNPADHREHAPLVVDALYLHCQSAPLDVAIAAIRIVAIGDSVMWGQGLKLEHKFASTVRDHIAGAHTEFGIYLDHRAGSGAKIGLRSQDLTQTGHVFNTDNINPHGQFAGEVAEGQRAMFEQALVQSLTGANDKELKQNAQDLARFILTGQQAAVPVTLVPDNTVDVVLIVGGANDVNMENVVNSLTGASKAETASQITRHMHDSMGDLLTIVGAAFPKAAIVVSGYYQIVSDQTSITQFALALAGVGAITEAVAVATVGALALATVTPAAIAATVVGGVSLEVLKTLSADKCADFAVKSTAALSAICSERSAMGKPVFFANPGFMPQNAMFTDASQTLLWGVDDSFKCIDEVVSQRIAAVNDFQTVLTNAHDPSDQPLSAVSIPIDYHASMFHPNIKGAATYAGVINGIIDHSISLPRNV